MTAGSNHDPFRWILDRLALQWDAAAASTPARTPSPEFCEAAQGLVTAHRVAGPLYRQTLSHPARFPQPFARWLRLSHSLTLLRYGHWPGEVGELLGALNAAGIRVLLLKGWALVAALYDGDLGQRPAMDLDIVVSPADIARARTALLELDYALPGDVPELWPGFNERYRSQFSYRRPSAGEPPLVVDLHVRPLNCCFDRLPICEWFERAQPVQIAGAEALAPSPEDHVLYLCGHVALHHPNDPALFRYHDMAALIRADDRAFEWRAVLRRAKTWRLVASLRNTLVRVEQLWPGTIPAEISREMTSLPVTRGERLTHRLIRVCRGHSDLHELAAVPAMPGLWRRSRFLLEQLFPSPAFMRWRYCPKHPRLWPLAYVGRFWTGFKAVLQRR